MNEDEDLEEVVVSKLNSVLSKYAGMAIFPRVMDMMREECQSILNEFEQLGYIPKHRAVVTSEGSCKRCVCGHLLSEHAGNGGCMCRCGCIRFLDEKYLYENERIALIKVKPNL